MSDLQIVLIVIGALIIVGVIIFNWWQERKFHQQVERSFSSLKNDVLLDDQILDVSSLNIAIDETAIDHLPFNDNQSEPEFIHVAPQAETMLVEDESALYTSDDTLTDAAPQDENQNVTTEDNSSISIKNELQHTDIKSIFNEAFKQSTKASPPITPSMTSVQTEAEIESTTSIDNEAPAETKPNIEDAALSLPSMLHSQIDLTAVLYLAKETSISELGRVFANVSNGYDKPVFVHVLDSNSQWSLLKELATNPTYSNQQSSKVTCSLQLADRAGAVSRNTLNRFQLAIESLGLDINAHVEWQGTGDALSAAT